MNRLLKLLKKTYQICVFVCALMSYEALNAQTQTNPNPPSETDIWGLQACIDYALKNNPLVGQSQISWQQAIIRHKQSSWAAWPTINAQATQSWNMGRSIDPFTNTVVENRTIGSNNYGLSANFNVFSGFQNQNSILRDRYLAQAGQKDLETTRFDVSLNVANAYLQLIFAGEQLETTQIQLLTTKGQLDRTIRLIKAGSLAQSNLPDLEAQLATENFNVATAQNQLDLARLNLLQIMQKPLDENFDIVRPELQDPNDSLPALSPAQIYEIAIGVQPQIQAAQARNKSNYYAIKVAKSSYMPTLSFQAGLFTNYSSIAPPRFLPNGQIAFAQATGFFADPSGTQPIFRATPAGTFQEFTYFKQLDNNLRRGITFSLNIPIFNGFQARFLSQTAKLVYESGQMNNKLIENRLRQTVEQTYTDARASFRRYKASISQVRALNESFRAATARFNAGMLNSLDYALSKNNLASAQINLIRSKYEFIFRRKVLDFYMGKPIVL